jgi:hypothetical protein
MDLKQIKVYSFDDIEFVAARNKAEAIEWYNSNISEVAAFENIRECELNKERIRFVGTEQSLMAFEKCPLITLKQAINIFYAGFEHIEPIIIATAYR